MKKRRICAILLILTMLLAPSAFSYAGSSPVYLTDIAGNANAQAITVCDYLGIVKGNPDGTYLPAKSVTRAEFAAMITRALAIPESSLSGFTNRFKDTAGYSWAVPYLSFCESKGIILGDGQGNVMPGKTISLNEAITMALRAVGYTDNSALLTGSWPSNYISIAQNNDLYEDVSSSTIVNRADAAQIIFNTLFVQKVVVSSDGETAYQKNSDDQEKTLLNTGLGCTMEEGVVDLVTYPDSLVNLVPYMGAYGEIYLNDDDEVVAVNPTVTRLSGNFSVDGTRFDLLDGTQYDIDEADYDSPACVLVENSVGRDITTFSELQSAIVTYSDYPYLYPGKAATIYADVKGKNISRVYSVSTFGVNDSYKAESDFQQELAEDQTINGWKLPLDDNGEIDYTRFFVYGVTSLADIKEDDTMWIYQDLTTSDEINYIEVGTGKISGEVTELDPDTNDYYDIYTINDQSVWAYKGTPYLEVGATYDITLDAYGCIFDSDKILGTDSYGVVKAASAETSFDNYKVKLYTSDSSTKTLYLSEEDPADIDWTSSGAATIGAVVSGGLIGYSLDSNGDIDAVDNTVDQFASGAKFKSTKVVGGLSIASDCVVFTYDGASAAADPGSYDVASLKDIDTGTVIADATYDGYYLLNDDGDVAAMLISSTFANADNDDIYGVFNTRKSTTNADGDAVYKFLGYIDGTAFTYLTDDQTNTDSDATGSYGNLAGTFGLYAITLDSSNVINKVASLETAFDPDNASGTVAAGIAADLGSDNTVFTIGSIKYVADDAAVVYEFDDDDDVYTVSKLSAIDENDTVILYDTKGTDADGIADVVLYIAN